MSVQFGKCNFDGRPVNPHDLEEVRPVLAPYGSDGEGYICKDNFGVLYRAFHTTKESRREIQPHVSRSGFVMTWDGRLDNRNDFIRKLRDTTPSASTDLEIVVAAYNCWGLDCLANFVGDWALSIWIPHSRTLILATDFLGSRHLFYSVKAGEVIWSSILDALLVKPQNSALNEKYIAGWISNSPAAHLTPYVGIHTVPPSSFVMFGPQTQTITRYWNFDPCKEIRYRDDKEYEEHFRVMLAQAVARRLRSDIPVLSELSGGLDSSSIVCMADKLIGEGISDAPRLDTISFYIDSEPNWNERPFLRKVEEKRGRIGCHIDAAGFEVLTKQFERTDFAATPAAAQVCSRADAEFEAHITSQGIRVVLSGIGGDEMTGGVPTPIPQLEDLLMRADFRALAHCLKIWALEKRKPWVHLLFEAARGFLPTQMFSLPVNKRPVPWLRAAFVRRNRAALSGYERRLRVFGPLPSFQENLNTLEGLKRQLACSVVNPRTAHETRYVYLDRDLLEFLVAIPRDQLVRPGQRRSLMRRALTGIVPDEILNRKRKAYVARAPMIAISDAYETLVELCNDMVASSMGIVDNRAFLGSLERVRRGLETPILPLIRTLNMEAWLRGLRRLKGESASAMNDPAMQLQLTE